MKIPHFLAAFVAVTGLNYADSFQTYQAADVVLGQPDFQTTTPVVGVANRFSGPQGVAFDPATGKVFVCDTSHNRVLRFSSAAAAQSNADPEFVFGQPSLTAYGENQNGAPSDKTLRYPSDIVVDTQGYLWVADTLNSRVLGFADAASTFTANPMAAIVLGEPDTTTTTGGITQATMRVPVGVSVGPDETLWVADRNNHRVLRFANASSKATGDPADGVLGQGSFTTAQVAASQAGMSSPNALHADTEGRLWVADSANNRVLRFDNAVSKAGLTGGAADGVLGQPFFYTTSTAPTASHFGSSFGVYLEASGTLWVSDFTNNRILGFPNAATLVNGADATLVLGQPKLDTAASSPADEYHVAALYKIGPGPGGSMLVADTGNNRVLRFTPIATPPTPTPTVEPTSPPTIALAGKKSSRPQRAS